MKDVRQVLRRRRRKVLLVLLSAPAVLLLVLGVAWAWLHSDAGQAFVREQVGLALKDALAGRVEYQRLELTGSTVTLRQLKLYTPEGDLVAEVEALTAEVALAALARKEVHLVSVEVDTPRLYLEQDERGLNLARAVAAKGAAAAKPPVEESAPVTWRVRVDSLVLSHGFVDAEGLGPRMTLDDLSADAHLALRLETLRADGALHLSARATSPLSAPLKVDVTASSAKGPTALDVALTLGDSGLKGLAEWPSAEFSLRELTLTPDTARAFVPSYPLKVAVYLTATGSPRRALVQARAGAATFDAAAAWKMEPLAVESLAVTLARADLAELLGVEKHSVVNATVKAAVPDARAESLTGSADVSATWDAPGVGRLAKVTLAAKASKGALTVDTLLLEAPGVTATAKGRASPKALDLSGELTAKDLSEFGRAISSFTGSDVPSLSGAGTLSLSVTGPARHPAVRAVGRLATLRVASVSAEALSVDADLPDVTHPLDTDVLLEARRVQVGGRGLSEVKLDFLTRGRELDVAFTTRGLGDVKLHATGELDKDRQGVQLATFEVKASDAAWTLEAPAHVGWGDVVTLEPLALRDGVQRVALSATLKRQRLEAQVEASSVDLSRLPRILSPEEWGLSGTLGLTARASGRLPQPDVEAKVALRRAGAFGVGDINLDVDGAWRGKRATAKAVVGTSVGSLDADVDVSLPALFEEKDEPVTASATVRDVDTEKVSALLKQPLPVKGVLGLQLSLSGTGAAPVASVTVEAPSLLVAAQPSAQAPPPREGVGRRRGEPVAQPVAFTLDRPKVTVETREGGKLGAKVSTSAFGGVAVVDVATPFTLSGLRAKPPTVAALQDTPVTVTVDVQGVRLRALDEAHLVEDDELAGVAGLSGRLEGTARAPRGALKLELSEVAFPPLAGVGATVSLSAEEQRTSLAAQLRLHDKPAGALDWKVETPVERLADLERVGEVPLALRASLFPVDLEQVMPKAEGDVGARGVASASVEVSGTLESPVARLSGSLQRLAFSKLALGSARFQVDSTGTEQRVSLALGGEGRDDLKVKGTTGLDVRLKTLRKGLDWRKAAVALTLDARELDLGFLSGVHPVVRVAGGSLSLAGTVKGTLGSPAFVGDATWKRGRLGLFGLGDYRDIDLALHATNDVVDLSKLRLRAGAGAASLQAKASRLPSGAFSLAADGSFDRFPVITDDQLLAVASLKVGISGEVTDELIHLRSVDLPRVDVELPDVKRKNLQDLARPKDIIVLRNGQRLTRRAREAAKEAAAEETQPSQGGRTLRAFLNAPRNIWVRSSDLNVELGLSEAFRVEVADQAQLFGEATILRGDLSVIGRAFQVQKGSQVRFAGPAKEPYVNVIALHNNEREKVKVTMTVVGKGTNVQLKTQSEPAMTDSEIYTLLATGRRELRRGSGASITAEDAVSVVGQLAASQLRNVLAKKLPIDVLNFETGENFSKVKVDLGKYLTDSLYLGFSAATTANKSKGENQFAGRLEWQVTRGWSLEVTGGDAPAGSADVVWSRDF
ncbi:MAG: translocation/assembly module TamB domain-containing protein [Myxococcota bacterium]